MDTWLVTSPTVPISFATAVEAVAARADKNRVDIMIDPINYQIVKD
jgi:hypothetical protein